MRYAPLLLVLLASAGSALFTAGCGTPGPEVRPMEGDFAFLEFKLGS